MRHLQIILALEMHTYSITTLIMVIHSLIKDKYTALLQQELQNPYWCLHDPVTIKSYQMSTEMDIETTPHFMYFSGNTLTVSLDQLTKYNSFITL